MRMPVAVKSARISTTLLAIKAVTFDKTKAAPKESGLRFGTIYDG
jgi:hypothetical protein